MTFYSIIFYFFFLLFSSLALYALVDLFDNKITFKVLINILFFVIFISFVLILLGLDFLGLVYIIVYAGAILVLFLSVLMFVNLRVEELSEASEHQSISKTEKSFNKNLKLLIVFTYVSSAIFIYLQENSLADSNKIDPFNDLNYQFFKSKDSIYIVGEILYTQY